MDVSLWNQAFLKNNEIVSQFLNFPDNYYFNFAVVNFFS